MQPLEILSQIEKLTSELRTVLSPPQAPKITTETELAAALAAGGVINVGPHVLTGNFVVTKPSVITLDPGCELVPANLLLPTLEVKSSGVVVNAGKIRNGAPDRETVVVGSPTAKDAEAQPTDVAFTETTVEAGPGGGHRGFALHGRRITLQKVRVLNFWEIGRESQAIWICNGPGPYVITESFLEGSGENILLGGSSLPCGQNPSALISGNTLFKPISWKGTKIVIKNSFEIKSGVDVVFQGNTIDGCWAQGQAGTPIVITPRNQNGDSPWTLVDRVKIEKNIVQNCPDGYAINILGRDNIYQTGPITTMSVNGNLFTDSWGGFLIGNAADLNLEARHNTMLGIRNTFLKFYGPALSSFYFTKNVVRSGDYGIHSDDGFSLGEATLKASATTLDFTGNVIEQSAARTLKYPAGNTVIPTGQLAALLDDFWQMRDGSAGWFIG